MGFLNGGIRTSASSECCTLQLRGNDASSAYPSQHDAHGKALSLNLDPSFYGTLAEIGAGQEVARFLAVGGASGTVAKTISASDKTVSRPQIKSLQPFHSLTLRRGFESTWACDYPDESALLRFIDPKWVIRRLSTEGCRRRFQHPSQCHRRDPPAAQPVKGGPFRRAQ